MSRETFVPKTFNAKHAAIIAAARSILKDYAAQGFDLTLRQLYYQFVARQPLTEPFENSQRSYKLLGSIVGDARLAGELDWTFIVDRTRGVEVPPTWETPGDIIESAAASYRIDKWKDQPYHVEAWVEKDALVGVLAKTCGELQIPHLSCRGYTSLSELYACGKRLRFIALSTQKRIVILHLGDHDPSGIDMSRDIEERVRMFSGLDDERDLEVRRIALTMEQVEEQGPPPNPTKITDSRATSYIDKFGMECWELDALSPTYIDGLIRAHVQGLRDEDKWAARKKREATERGHLAAVSARWDDVPAALGLSEEE